MTVRDLSARMTELGQPVLPSGITKIEQGQRRVDADDLVALAIALAVNPSRLLLPADAGDQQVSLTPTRSVPAWAAWQWADAFAPLLPSSGEDNTPAEREDFELHSRPAEIRREQQHPLIRAVAALRFSASRAIRQATKDAREPDVLKSTLSYARRDVQRVSSELDTLEEEAATRG